MSSLVIRGKSTNADKVWLRISAFLSLKSPATRVTYSGIIAEWCRFLRTEPGTSEAADAIIGATDLHAIAYRKFLEKKPGKSHVWLEWLAGFPPNAELRSRETRVVESKKMD